MSKILKAILLFLGATVVATAIMLILPSIPVKHNMKEYGISIVAPNYYAKVENENALLILKSKNNIEISAVSFGKEFFNADGAYNLALAYEELIAAMNYDTIVQNLTISEIDAGKTQIGKVEFEIKSIKQIDKDITLAIPLENNDVIITISGTKEVMESKNEEIQKIVNSLEIK